MSEIKIYELMDLIPLIKVNGEVVQENNPQPIGNVLLPDEADKTQFNDLNRENGEQEQPLHWLIENQLLGELGEQIALKYFQSIYDEVVYTAHDTYLGYDLKVKLDNENHVGVEVKTSLNNWGFHISYNELHQAYRLKESSGLFFIHLDMKDKVLLAATGYFSINPLHYFEVDFDTLTAPTIHESATITPNKFYFELNPNHLKEFSQAVDLMTFIEDDDIQFFIR